MLRKFVLVSAMLAFCSLGLAQVAVQPVADPGPLREAEGLPAGLSWDRVAYRMQLEQPQTVTVEWWLNGRRLDEESKAFKPGPLTVATGYGRAEGQGCSLYWSVTLEGGVGEAQKAFCLEIAPLAPEAPVFQGALPGTLEPGTTYLLAWFHYADALSRTSDLAVTLRLE